MRERDIQVKLRKYACRSLEDISVSSGRQGLLRFCSSEGFTTSSFPNQEPKKIVWMGSYSLTRARGSEGRKGKG